MRTIHSQNWNARVSQPLKVPNRILQRHIRGARVVEKVARNYHEVWFKRESFVHDFGEGVVEVLPPHL